MADLRDRWIRAVVAAAIGLTLQSLPGAAWCSPAARPSPLRVMTFNVLHDDAWSLAPSWEARRRVVAEAIRSARPDVVCLQEVSPRQLRHISLDLVEYQVFPGRLSGGTTLTGWARPGAFLGRLVLGDFFDRGEYCPILLRRHFGAPIDSGSFLLASDTPTPHVVNWVRIRLPSEALVDVFSTHLGLVRGRKKDTPEALLRVLDEHRGGTQILAGDLNALPSGRMLRALTAEGDPPARAFQDAWTGARRGPRGGTLHWGLGLPGPRLDYVLVRPPCAIDSVRVAGTRVGRTLPSDHYAVVADLRLGGPVAGASAGETAGFAAAAGRAKAVFAGTVERSWTDVDRRVHASVARAVFKDVVSVKGTKQNRIEMAFWAHELSDPPFRSDRAPRLRNGDRCIVLAYDSPDPKETGFRSVTALEGSLYRVIYDSGRHRSVVHDSQGRPVAAMNRDRMVVVDRASHRNSEGPDSPSEGRTATRVPWVEVLPSDEDPGTRIGEGDFLRVVRELVGTTVTD